LWKQFIANYSQLNQIIMKKHWILGLALLGIIVGIILYLTGHVAPSMGEYAMGYFAAGNFAAGVFAIGNFSIGIFSVGIFSIGIFSLGIFNIGLYTIGFFLLGWHKKAPKIFNH
jgi:hypothetical protein